MADFDFQQTAQELQEFVNRTPAEIAELRALYEALTQTGVTPVAADDWPVSDPQQNVIYRVAGESSYTDYMWDGTDFIPMATYNNVPTDIPAVGSTDVITAGGVANHGSAFDISEYNKNGATLATYADLSAALAAVPTTVQKGGMSIKFVQSSDNKYVQYRLMATSFSTTPSDWQGVDIDLVSESKNLIEGGAVEKVLPFSILIGNGNTQSKTSDYPVIKEGNTYRIWVTNPNAGMSDVTYTGNQTRFGVIALGTNGNEALINIPCSTKANPLEDYYDVTIPKNQNFYALRVNARFNIGEKQIVIIQDITYSKEIKSEIEKIRSVSVYDVSLFNPTEGIDGGNTYTDLSAALSVIPLSSQIAGMTVKFISGTSGKYEEYRLTTDEWSNDVSDWQGVLDDIKIDSNDLISVKGVSKNIPYSHIIGKGDSASNSEIFYNIKEGNTYRIWLSNPNIGTEDVTYRDAKTRFGVVVVGNNGNIAPINIPCSTIGEALADYYDVTIPKEEGYYGLRIITRAGTGNEQIVIIQDITCVGQSEKKIKDYVDDEVLNAEDKMLNMLELPQVTDYDAFVFIGQSNMMGAPALEPASEEKLSYSFEYKYKDRLLGSNIGQFVPSKNPAGEWLYKNPSTAYNETYLNPTTGKSTLTNYSNNTNFVSAMSNAKNDGTTDTNQFSVYSEDNYQNAASLPPYFAREYAKYGRPCIYSHIAKGATRIEYYFNDTMRARFEELLNVYNQEHGTSLTGNFRGISSQYSAHIAFENKVNSMFIDFTELFDNKTIRSKSIIMLQGESNDDDGMIEYKLKLQVLWEYLQTLGFTKFFICRVDYWGDTNVINVMKAQEEFCNETQNAYIITRAYSYMIYSPTVMPDWFIEKPDDKYYYCKDNFYGYANAHVNEKGHKLASIVCAKNVYRVLIKNQSPILEEELIEGLITT